MVADVVEHERGHARESRLVANPSAQQDVSREHGVVDAVEDGVLEGVGGGERHGGEAAFPHEELVGVFGRLAFGDVDADKLAELR